MTRAQTKSKERVRKNGEVFTAKREVKSMLDLVKHETEKIDSTFLEPACGDGNFLVEILSRKLKTAIRTAGKNDADFEYLATRAFASIYGVDIMEDNVDEARERMYAKFFTQFVNKYQHHPTNICIDSIRFILSQNIQCGNTLTAKTNDGNDLIITKWAFDEGNGLTISLFRYSDMISSGVRCGPVKVLPRIPYIILPAVIKACYKIDRAAV